MQCAVCSVQCAVCSMQYAVCSVQCAVCSMQCAVCSVQCAVCSSNDSHEISDELKLGQHITEEMHHIEQYDWVETKCL